MSSIPQTLCVCETRWYLIQRVEDHVFVTYQVPMCLRWFYFLLICLQRHLLQTNGTHGAWHSDITLQWSKAITRNQHLYMLQVVQWASGNTDTLDIYAIDWYRTNAARIRYDQVWIKCWSVSWKKLVQSVSSTITKRAPRPNKDEGRNCHSVNQLWAKLPHLRAGAASIVRGALPLQNNLNVMVSLMRVGFYEGFWRWVYSGFHWLWRIAAAKKQRQTKNKKGQQQKQTCSFQTVCTGNMRSNFC